MEIMHRIILEHSVTPSDGVEQNWEIEIELPFVPWAGLDLVDLFDSDGVTYTVTKVYWYGSRAAFVVGTKPEAYPSWDAKECEKDFLGVGWTRQ